MISETQDATRDETPKRRWADPVFWGACLLAVAIYGTGIGLRVIFFAKDFSSVKSGKTDRNVFHVLFQRLEPVGSTVWIVILLGAILAALIALLRRPRSNGPSRRLPTRAIVIALALAVVAVTWWGNSAWLHAYPFSMDEHSFEFQSEIFARGEWAAEVPEIWRSLIEAIQPVFVEYDGDTGRWYSNYLPLYSMMRAVTRWIHPSFLLNPLLAGLSLLLLARIAGRLWPDRPSAPIVAALFLALSPQFLVTSATFYSMSAHLAFNLIWLWLYLRDDRLGWTLLPFVGVAAMGLHQYAMHVIFAFPFLALLVWRRRWAIAAWTASVYSAGLVTWVAWMEHWRNEGNLVILETFWGLPGEDELYLHLANLSLAATWQVPVLAVLLVVGIADWRHLPTPAREMLLSIGLTFAFYCFYYEGQGHGWGYRYLFPVLGNQVILALGGVYALECRLGGAAARSFCAVGLVGALLVQIPLRTVQVEQVVRPFATSSAWMESLPVDFVVVQGEGTWYGWDLLRNDPFFERRPMIFESEQLYRENLDRLEPLGTVRGVWPAELAEFGMWPITDDTRRLKLKQPEDEEGGEEADAAGSSTDDDPQGTDDDVSRESTVDPG
ncbi:MAG: hypothetical protein AAGE94_00230 [Acidobacteriota bacterium]